MKNLRLKFTVLSLASAVLLSLGFLFPHCGGFALIAFVPLLWMDSLATRYNVKHFFLWYYLCFVLFNAFTTYWVCNATVAGGIAAIVINAIFPTLIWSAYRLFRRYWNGALPYIFLAALWITWERFFFDAEISWPWLTLGNAFASSTSCIQWYEITGMLGGSVWIWCCNLAVFGVMSAMESGRWKKWNSKARAAAIAGAAAVFILPLSASWIRYATISEAPSASIRTCALQPNFDPYDKYVSMSQYEQNKVIVKMMEEAGKTEDAPVLFLTPEAFSNDVILNDLSYSPTLHTFKDALKEHPGARMIFGASSYEFFTGERPSYTAKRRFGNEWYENHNTALMLNGADSIQYYHKSRLVVGTEKLPWPRIMSKVEDWLGGDLLGHCIGQEEAGLLYFDKDTPIGCAICYESIFPEYFASFVAKGALAMTVITNDAWWGNTAGYRQHLDYSRLRAIETRRNIMRCANTGISANINIRGDIVEQTNWWEREALTGDMQLHDEITPFVRHGDICGRLCTFIAVLLALTFLRRNPFSNNQSAFSKPVKVSPKCPERPNGDNRNAS